MPAQTARERGKFRRIAWASSFALFAGLGPGAALAQRDEPFHIRNLNPLVAIFGLPAWDTVQPGSRIGATAELANHYRFSLRGDDMLILDGETWRTTLSYSHGFGDRWAVGAEVPYYRQTGGVLDDLIDGWHSAFGLPDGGRNARPEGEIWYRMEDAAGPFYELDHSAGGWGDAQLKLARAIGRNRKFVVQGSAKLATGDESVLAGSGAVDVALTILRSERASLGSRPAGYFWGAGVVHVGEPEIVRFDADSIAYTGVIGGSARFWPRIGLKGQLDYHSAFYDSLLEEIGEAAIQATLGAWIELGERGTLEMAVVEDLEVSTAPDVVLHVAATWRW